MFFPRHHEPVKRARNAATPHCNLRVWVFSSSTVLTTFSLRQNIPRKRTLLSSSPYTYKTHTSPHSPLSLRHYQTQFHFLDPHHPSPIMLRNTHATNTPTSGTLASSLPNARRTLSRGAISFFQSSPHPRRADYVPTRTPHPPRLPVASLPKARVRPT